MGDIKRDTRGLDYGSSRLRNRPSPVSRDLGQALSSYAKSGLKGLGFGV